MIELAIALNRIALFTDDAVRAAVVAAIFDGRVLGGLGVRDEQPEDVFVPLLVDTGNPRRPAVLAGCRDVLVRFNQILSEPSPPSSDELADAAAHLASLLGHARPQELSRHVRSLLELALDPSITETIREPFVGLAVDYAPIDPRPEYWQDLLAGNLIPGYAFQALLRIDPHHVRLEGYLANLWQRALAGEISLRMPFVVEQWARKQPVMEDAIRAVLQELISGSPELCKAVNDDCARYPHSAAWVNWFPSAFVPTQAPIIELTRPKADLLFTSSDVSRLAERLRRNIVSKLILKPDVFEFGEGAQLMNITIPRDVKIYQQRIIAPRSFQMVTHVLSIVHSSLDLEVDQVVTTALNRFAANIPGQVLSISDSEVHKSRA